MAIKPVSVSQLNGYIKRVLQADPLLGNVSVIGEISNVNYHYTGHIYFSLKDEKSKINCFMPSDKTKTLRYELADGMEVTLSGYINVYEKGGYYSFNVSDVEVSGQGGLSVAFDKLKEKLFNEGMFDAKHKKQLPKFPSKIALVTANNSAALSDMLKIIKSRNNIIDILVYPVAVQGAGAGQEIANAVKVINENHKDVEIIIAGRGGGSAEDLWAFNEEAVARSIFESKIPVISAVGHEIDVTIADFVADVRAETPTAAAQLATPDIEGIKSYLDSLKTNVYDTMNGYVKSKQRLLDFYNMDAFIKNFENKINLYMATMNSFKVKLDSLNPKHLMSLGYGAILDENGKLVRTASAFKSGDKLTAVLADGKVESVVI